MGFGINTEREMSVPPDSVRSLQRGFGYATVKKRL